MGFSQLALERPRFRCRTPEFAELNLTIVFKHCITFYSFKLNVVFINFMVDVREPALLSGCRSQVVYVYILCLASFLFGTTE
jgi:hypothetical protein